MFTMSHKGRHSQIMAAFLDEPYDVRAVNLGLPDITIEHVAHPCACIIDERAVLCNIKVRNPFDQILEKEVQERIKGMRSGLAMVYI